MKVIKNAFAVSLPRISTSNSSETALKQQLLRPDVDFFFLIGLTETYRAKMSFSVFVCVVGLLDGH